MTHRQRYLLRFSFRLLVLFAGTCFTAQSPAQLTARVGQTGVVEQVQVGRTDFLRDVAVAVPAPGWSGNLAEQAQGTVVKRSRDSSGSETIELRLGSSINTFLLKQTTKLSSRALRLDYELTAEHRVQVETVLIRLHLPTDRHAGRSKYWAPGVSAEPLTLPAHQNPTTHLILSTGTVPWLGFATDDGAAVRVVPSGAELQLQDNRRWNTPVFELFAATGGGFLEPDKPVRFGLTIEATTVGELDERTRHFAGGEFLALPLSDNRPLRIIAFKPDRSSVSAYETVTFTATLEATYDNPFDPDQIAVDAEVRDGEGTVYRIPGFYFVPARVETEGNRELMRVAGEPCFQVRFTPRRAGTYTAILKVRNRDLTAESELVPFEVVPSSRLGFVKVSSRNPHYFAFEDGSPYIAIGENVCWAWGQNPLRDYRQWFEGLGRAGGNWARLWLAYNEKGLEWSAQPTPRPGTGAYRGLGKYALDNAWRLDEILRLAEANGIYLMFCLGTYGEFTEGGFFNEGMWISNPYNARNGGPCATPAEFWTNEQARKLYKQRLRYLIARYAHSPHLFAWEFWNEVPPTPDQEKWVAEMAAFVKENDPYGHLVSTTYGSPRVWECPHIDFTMTHMYGTQDSTADFTPQIVAHTHDHRRFGKPYLLAEFGIDWQSSDQKWDPTGTGINMHNGAWAALMAGGAGTAMMWYWDNYVHPHNLYRILTPVARFAKAVDWQAEPLEPLTSVDIQTAPDAPETFKDLTVSGDVDWGLTPGNRFVVRHDGKVEGRPIPMAIGSPTRSTTKELHSEVTFELDLRQPTTVTLKLGNVCTRARMIIKVDDEVRVDRTLTAGEPGQGPWKSSRKLEQYDVWVSDYDEDIPLPIPAGRHTITIANTEGDWFQIRSITIPGYQSSRYPDVNAVGLAGTKTFLLWLHNRESTWKRAHAGKEPQVLEGLRVNIPVAVDGSWRVDWWDTWTGEVVRTDELTASYGKLLLLPPPLKTDIAVRGQRVEK